MIEKIRIARLDVSILAHQPDNRLDVECLGEKIHHRQSLDLTQMKSVQGNLRLKDVSAIGDGK